MLERGMSGMSGMLALAVLDSAGLGIGLCAAPLGVIGGRPLVKPLSNSPPPKSSRPPHILTRSVLQSCHPGLRRVIAHNTIIAYRSTPQVWLANDGLDRPPRNGIWMRLPKTTPQTLLVLLDHRTFREPTDGCRRPTVVVSTFRPRSHQHVRRICPAWSIVSPSSTIWLALTPVTSPCRQITGHSAIGFSAPPSVKMSAKSASASSTRPREP